MKKLVLFSLFVIFGLGCRAHMMETHGDEVTLMNIGKEKGPRGGVIRYLSRGHSSWAKARRSDAERQMKDFCKGPYTVTAEGPRSKFGADMPIGKSVTLEVDEYWYMRFECQK